MEDPMSSYRPLLSIRRARRPRLLFIVSAVLAAALVPKLGPAQDMTHPPAMAPGNARDSAKEILSRYAQAWRGKEEMDLREEAVLAFWVTGDTGGEYHVILRPEGPGHLVEGIPKSYTFGFEADIETLRRIDRGEWNAFTAMGQARGSDTIPLVPRAPEGFKWTPENRGYLIPLFFHFWNRDWPERVLFGEGTTRPVHGANTTIFYYDKGLRTAWYQVKAGMHVNADPADQTNEFHTLVIMSRGAVKCRLGGVERLLREGEAVFIPAGMPHEFWAEPDQYGEFIILMFGEKA
jgi:mannose-6-phosphate isomerase-like protein (cupin superfamily)